MREDERLGRLIAFIFKVFFRDVFQRVELTCCFGRGLGYTQRLSASSASPLDTFSPCTGSPEGDLLQSGYRFALALTHHREEAEDLVQETWLNLCRRYGQVENQAVLFSSIRNLFIDQCRRKKLAYFESLDQPDVADVAYSPDEEPCVQGELSKLLGRLNPKEREAIFLHYYQGNTAEEISQLTGQPRGTVLSLLHRTILKLRKLSESDGHFTCNQLMLFFVILVTLARSHRS